VLLSCGDTRLSKCLTGCQVPLSAGHEFMLPNPLLPNPLPRSSRQASRSPPVSHTLPAANCRPLTIVETETAALNP
jgi:hypothetical protein